MEWSGVEAYWHIGKKIFVSRPVRLTYQPPASSTFLSQQTNHQQSASSIFLSEQTSISHPPNEQAVCRPG
jgi:hypothetical protein